MNTPILFLGQCKQGSNSLFDLLAKQEGLVKGHDIRAMVSADFEDTDYFANWSNINTTNAKYLLDKSIINPLKYDYHVGEWQNFNHRMIYMIRDIYKVLRSQFLIVLAGEASYQYCIPKHAKTWNTGDHFGEQDVIEVLNYNRQKVMHLENIKALPPDVFDLRKNVYFCTFENMKENTKEEFGHLERFLGVPLNHLEYPHVNRTYCDWYAENTKLYEQNLSLFEKHKEFIYDHFVKKEEWEELSEIIGIDLVSLYGIK